MSESLILKHYKIEGNGFRYRTKAEAKGSRLYNGGQVEEVAHEYRVDDPVEVHAYGAWRPGKVVHLARLRVVVHYERNRRGAIAAKAFHGAEVRPRGEGRWVQS